ncbi:MAG: hypothetical protein WKG07_03470 [Hymenobacter sp.]
MPQFQGYVYKVVVRGLSGNDGNLYRFFLSSSPNLNVPIAGGTRLYLPILLPHSGRATFGAARHRASLSFLRMSMLSASSKAISTSIT